MNNLLEDLVLRIFRLLMLLLTLLRMRFHMILLIENASAASGPYFLLANLLQNAVAYLHSGLYASTAQYYHIRAVNSSIGQSNNASTANTTQTFIFPLEGL